jgi:hypothetical protein
VITLEFIKDDVTRSGFRCGEVASFEVDAAARILVRGVAVLVGEETEALRAAIAVAKRPRNARWQMPLVAAHHRWRLEG